MFSFTSTFFGLSSRLIQSFGKHFIFNLELNFLPWSKFIPNFHYFIFSLFYQPELFFEFLFLPMKLFVNSIKILFNLLIFLNFCLWRVFLIFINIISSKISPLILIIFETLFSLVFNTKPINFLVWINK